MLSEGHQDNFYSFCKRTNSDCHGRKCSMLFNYVFAPCVVFCPGFLIISPNIHGEMGPIVLGHPGSFHSLRLGDAIWRHGPSSSLVQIMARCRHEPLPEPLLIYHQLDSIAISQWNFIQYMYSNNFIAENALQNGGHFVQASVCQ